MTLDYLEALIWSQARNLNNPDPVIARTAMEAIRAAVTVYTDHAAGPIVAQRRRNALEATP